MNVRTACLAGAIATTVVPTVAWAQRSGYPWRSDDAKEYSQFNVPYDGRFTFVRLRYDPLTDWGGRRWRDIKWDHDYPRAERHLMKLLSELSLIQPYMDGGNILAVDDPELFKYPVAYLSEPGFWTVSDQEAANLRAYLQKGGFLIIDDFVGPHWFNFEDKIKKVLPDGRLIELDVTHPIFHSFYDVEALPEEHPYYREARPVFYGIFEDNDPTKRMMVIVNYNNDVGEYWEWSDEGFFPIPLTNEAYKIGINYIIYAMTH